MQEINCVNNAAVAELMRGLRSQLSELISGLAGHDMAPMSLGLSHSLSRYKLKFSPDKVDTMIVQAIGLLDDLDKELNTYAMRVREWYGWHFPELAKIVQDNVQYAKSVKLMGSRTNAADLDFSGVSVHHERMEEELRSIPPESVCLSPETCRSCTVYSVLKMSICRCLLRRIPFVDYFYVDTSLYYCHLRLCITAAL